MWRHAQVRSARLAAQGTTVAQLNKVRGGNVPTAYGVAFSQSAFRKGANFTKDNNISKMPNTSATADAVAAPN